MWLADYNYKRARQNVKNIKLVRELIAIRSYPHVHSELLFHLYGKHISFSSTLEDKAKGCRFKIINYTSGNWDFVYIPATIEQELASFEEAMRMTGFNPSRFTPEFIIGMTCNNYQYSIDTNQPDCNMLSRAKALKYGLWGASSFATPFDIIKPRVDKPWCSFAVARAIQAGPNYRHQDGWQRLVHPIEMHPEQLHQVCVEVYENEDTIIRTR